MTLLFIGSSFSKLAAALVAAGSAVATRLSHCRLTCQAVGSENTPNLEAMLSADPALFLVSTAFGAIVAEDPTIHLAMLGAIFDLLTKMLVRFQVTGSSFFDLQF
jgi:hypothetical protein